MKPIQVLTVVAVISLTALSGSGCNGSGSHKSVGTVGQGYTVTSQELPSNRLQVGENAVFKFAMTANEEIFLDRIAVRFESNSNGHRISRIEMREGANLTTLPNSIIAFSSSPTFSLETSIVMNRLVRQGETITFVVIVDLQQVASNQFLQMKLVNAFGRANFRGVDIDPLPTPILGPSLEG